MMYTESMNDTIAAIATAKGEGGIAIIRISGKNALDVLKNAFRPAKNTDFSGRRLVFGYMTQSDGTVLDEAMAVFMRAPHTYTRENVAEIQCHGGRVASERTLQRVLECGARLAENGEFTKRAFLNGRIDLSQAEAVMQLISAGSEATARSAVRQMEGGASGFIKKVMERLTHALSMIEASDDYPEEIGDEDFLPQVQETLHEAEEALLKAADEKNARMIREGVSVVLIGRTNAGKSSLMNALLGQDRAIVTEIPGTTRDVLTATLDVEGIRLELSDTAGQRETEDKVERIGVERAKQMQKNADVVLLLLDGSGELSEEDQKLLSGRDERTIVVLNKNDIAKNDYDCPVDIRVSAKTGEGIEALLRRIVEKSGALNAEEQSLTAQRHIEAAKKAAGILRSAIDLLDAQWESDIAAGEIMAALEVLSEITGENASEMVIDRVFKDFCVGK